MIRTGRKSRVASIDLFKFICAIFVVAIHTSAAAGCPEAIRFFLTEVVFRLAVPFFCMATGYFLAEKLEFANGKLAVTRENKRCIANLWKKNAKLYICWSVVYLLVYIPLWKRIGWLSAWAFVDWGIAAIRQGSYYHLWYILSLLYALPMFAVLIRVVNRRRLLPLAGILYLIKAISYAYRSYVPEIGQVLFTGLDAIGSVGTALTLILPYFILGMHAYEKQTEKIRSLFWFSVSIILVTAEALMIRYTGGTSYSYIFFSMPAAYFFFHMIMKMNNGMEEQNYCCLAKLSVFVYCVHPAANAVLEGLIKEPGLLRFVSVLSISVLWGALASKMKSLTHFRSLNHGKESKL